MKRTLLSIITAAVGVGFAIHPINVYADLTTNSGFGTIPGLPATGANPYSGSGIPYDTSEYSVVSGIPYTPPIGPDPSDTLTLAMAATQHGSGNPAPGNNGAGTYTVGTGTSGGRSLWNFDFYVNSELNALAAYDITITEKNVGNGESFTFNPLLIPDNVGGPASAGNSESLDFAAFGGPISYNPNLNDTYDFTLSGSFDGTTINSDSIVVVAATGAVVSAPDTASTAGLLAAGFGCLIVSARRARCKGTPAH